MTAPLQLRLPGPASPTAAALQVVSGLPPAARTGQAWLAIHLPDWPLQAAMRELPAEQRAVLTGRPVVVIDGSPVREVLCCNEPARRCGVHPGQRLNAALALNATLTCLPRRSEAEQRLLETLADRCQRFTPAVVMAPPDELLLELRASFRLFGGQKALLRAIDDDLQDQDIDAVLAMTSTAPAAQWLARAAPGRCIVPAAALGGRLVALPVRVLRWPEDICRRLRRFGVMSIGDLLRLPRSGLARRIGPARLREIDQALGRHADAHRIHRPREDFHDHVILDAEVQTTALAGALIVQRLKCLEAFLRRLDGAVSGLEIRLHHRGLPPTPLRVGLAAATADMSHLARLLQEALGALRLPAPVREIELIADAWCVREPAATMLALEPHAPGSGAAHAASTRLLEQLRARLGAERVRTLGWVADHRPERTQVEAAAGAMPGDSRPAGLPPLPLRPLWLLQEPRLLVAGEVAGHAAQPARQAERIQGGWWDGVLVERDYHLVRSRQGSLWWVFRDRAQPGALFLHGLFG